MAGETCDVLILGASFAGIELFHRLRGRRAGRRLKIVVVDRQTSHGYIPLVQERLVERMDLKRTELTTAQAVELAGGRYVVGDVVGFDPDARTATLASGERVSGRFVVVALGSDLAPPPGLPGREHLIGYKFAGEFDDAHAHLVKLLAVPKDSSAAQGAVPKDSSAAGSLGGEPAVPKDSGVVGSPGGESAVPKDSSASRRLVVIGGGISGVELAGELGHLRSVRPSGWVAPEVTLIQAGARLLPDMTERAGRRAELHLRRQGVDVRLGTRVVKVMPGAVAVNGVGGAEEIACGGAYWAGGVRPAPVLADCGLPRTPGGWLQVGPTLQCFPTQRPSRPDIFACGDAVRVVGGAGEWPTMQRAIECIWQAGIVARNILRLAAEPAGYPRGVPALQPHVLWPDFPYGVSIGGASLVVYGRLMFDNAVINTWFRRFLMRRYFARYR